MASERTAKEIETRAIELIPVELPKLMQRAFSLRTRALLVPRDFQSIFHSASDLDLIQSSFVRFWAAELINKAGIKRIGKTPEYNQAKIAVRAAIIRHIQATPVLQVQFQEITRRRAKKSLFARTRKKIRRS